MNYVPFVYLLTFKPTGQFYYGSRTAKNCQTSDLWTTYFTSSKVVEKLIEEHGKDAFEFEVRKTFETREKTLEWETRFLKRVNAAKNPRFLNKANGDGKLYCQGHTLETRAKMSISGKNKPPRTAESCAKTGAGHKGKTVSEETRAKLSSAKIGIKMGPFSEEHIKNMTIARNKNPSRPGAAKHLNLIPKIGALNPFFGKTHTEEIRQELSLLALGRPKYTCTHCSIECTISNLTRWHMDNCKQKPK